LENGIVLAVPIPDKDAGDGMMIERAIQQALKESDEQGSLMGNPTDARRGRQSVDAIPVEACCGIDKGRQFESQYVLYPFYLMNQRCRVGAE
jgi:hypothetical protein